MIYTTCEPTEFSFDSIPTPSVPQFPVNQTVHLSMLGGETTYRSLSTDWLGLARPYICQSTSSDYIDCWSSSTVNCSCGRRNNNLTSGYCQEKYPFSQNWVKQSSPFQLVHIFFLNAFPVWREIGDLLGMQKPTSLWKFAAKTKFTYRHV